MERIDFRFSNLTQINQQISITAAAINQTHEVFFKTEDLLFGLK